MRFDDTQQSALSNCRICKHQYFLIFDHKQTDQPTNIPSCRDEDASKKVPTIQTQVLTNKIFLQQRAHVPLSLLKPLRGRPFANVDFINDRMRIDFVDIVGDYDDDDGDKKQSPRQLHPAPQKTGHLSKWIIFPGFFSPIKRQPKQKIVSLIRGTRLPVRTKVIGLLILPWIMFFSLCIAAKV